MGFDEIVGCSWICSVWGWLFSTPNFFGFLLRSFRITLKNRIAILGQKNLWFWRDEKAKFGGSWKSFFPPRLNFGNRCQGSPNLDQNWFEFRRRKIIQSWESLLVQVSSTTLGMTCKNTNFYHHLHSEKEVKLSPSYWVPKLKYCTKIFTVS